MSFGPLWLFPVMMPPSILHIPYSVSYSYSCKNIYESIAKAKLIYLLTIVNALCDKSKDVHLYSIDVHLYFCHAMHLQWLRDGEFSEMYKTLGCTGK